MSIQNETPSISFGVLRKIADHMSSIPISDILELFEEYKVPNSVINRHEKETKTLVYHTFKVLALSKKPEDENTLKKLIIAYLNPALYSDKSITEKDIVELYNQWLKEDAKETVKQIVRLGSKYLLVDNIIPDLEREEIVGQESELTGKIFQSVVKPYLMEMVEAQEGYKLLLQLVTNFFNAPSILTQQLNDQYVELVNILKADVEKVNKGIKKDIVKEIEKDPLTALQEITPIFRDNSGKEILYIPFANLYLAEKEMQTSGVIREEVLKKMEACCGELIHIAELSGVTKHAKYPSKSNFNEILMGITKSTASKNYLSSLTFGLKNGNLTYYTAGGNKYSGKLGGNTNGFKLLKLLMSQPPETVLSYSTLAKHLKDKKPNIDSDDKRRVIDAVNYIRKKLKLKDNDSPFITRNGYGLNCLPILTMD